MVDEEANGGIHAATIRFHNGKFYIITTNVYQPKKDEQAQMINFIITASKPEGPWSDPIIVEGAPGIDPHIFFDDNGKIFYICFHGTILDDNSGRGANA